MKTRYLVMGVGAAVAAALYLNRDEKKDNEQWNKGFRAGWITPGPMSVLVLTGLVAFNV